MVTRLCAKTADIQALIQRITHDETVVYEQLMQGLQQVDWQYRQEETLFDRLDAVHQNANFPPQGRWPNNDQGKYTQTASSDV